MQQTLTLVLPLGKHKMKAKLTSVGVLAAAIGLFSADASKANDLVWDKSADTFIAEYDCSAARAFR